MIYHKETLGDRLAAIIVSYESAGVLAGCLQSLAAQGVRAVVVDNASSDASAAIAKAQGAKVIVNAQNEGFGRAMNIGVRAATADYCLLINPDTTLDDGCIQVLMDAASQNPDAGILAPRIVEPDGRVFFQPRSLLANFLPNPDAVQNLPEGNCCAPFVSGACMLVRREVFLQMGGFDPNIFLFYEDDDLCRRMSDAGKSIIYVHGAIIRHLRGKSVAPSLKHTYTVRYHLAFSRAYISRKYGLRHLGFWLLLVSFGKLLVALCACNKNKIARQWGSLRGNLAGIFSVCRIAN
jgi:GT2 family glycosyltransferase